MLPHVIELSMNHEWKFKNRSILISVNFYLLCLLKPLVLHISAGLIGSREIRMTRMKRIIWFREHLQSSRDKPFRHSEISASTLHYRVTPFSFSSMGATISTLVWMLTSLLTSYLRQDPSISPVLLRVILSVQLQSA